jgi:nucleoside-diphosphate-sugar epimerase
MRVLVIGGAGYVGSILSPALQAHYTCYHFDRKPVPDAADRSTVGYLDDAMTVGRAVEGMDCIVWLAMGVNPEMGHPRGSQDLDAAFDVNVRDLFRVLRIAHNAGVQRFVYASSLSVYGTCSRRESYPLDESEQPDAWDAYGMSKRLGEALGAAWVQQSPQATFVGLRLLWPRNDKDWATYQNRSGRIWYPVAPNDLRRLFVAAVACEKPGCHIVQASGDLSGEFFPVTRATELLGWRPEGN